MKRRHDTRPVTTSPDEFVRCTEIFRAKLNSTAYLGCQCIKAKGHNNIEHKAVIPGGVVRWRVKSERRRADARQL